MNIHDTFENRLLDFQRVTRRRNQQIVYWWIGTICLGVAAGMLIVMMR